MRGAERGFRRSGAICDAASHAFVGLVKLPSASHKESKALLSILQTRQVPDRGPEQELSPVEALTASVASRPGEADRHQTSHTPSGALGFAAYGNPGQHSSPPEVRKANLKETAATLRSPRL